MPLPWVERPCIDLDLGVPVENRYDHVPPSVFEEGRRLVDAIMSEVPPRFGFIADLIRFRTGGRFHSEAISLARKGGTDWRSVIIGNVSYDLATAFLGCSTAAIPTPHGPVVARNMDWWPEDILAQTSYLIRAFRDGELAYANAGWPGSIGVVTGLSGRGFGVVLNAVGDVARYDKLGYPVLLHIRRVLEDAAGFQEAVSSLSQQRLMVPGLLTVVGTHNDERVVVERSPRGCALRWGEADQALIATNDYRSLFADESGDWSELEEMCCPRYEALSASLRNRPVDGMPDDAELLYRLTDANVIQDITAQHVIMHPRSRTIRLYVPRRLIAKCQAG